MNTQMRKLIAALSLSVAIIVPNIVSAAPIITITDLTDGPPVVTFAGFPSTVFFNFPPVSTPESLRFGLFFSNPAVGDSGPSTSRIQLFDDPPLTRVSDQIIAKSFSGSSGSSLPGNQFLDLTFISDTAGDAGLALVPFALPTVFTSALETGAPQTFSIPGLCQGCIDITLMVTSDLEPVPLPAGIWLLGSALGGINFMRRRLS